jgi:ribbon-helix-helix CopG family protein
MVKVTFTLDEPTVTCLRQSAARLARPQSAVVRDAIRDYADRLGRLNDGERRQMLDAFDALVPKIPKRPLRETEREIREIRRARRRGGRRSSHKR